MFTGPQYQGIGSDLVKIIDGLDFIINRPTRPEGPMRWPGMGNAGGLFVFFATFGYHLCTNTIVTTS